MGGVSFTFDTTVPQLASATMTLMPKPVQNLRLLRGIAIVMACVGLSGCWAGYALRQGLSQASLLLRQKPLAEALRELPPRQAELAEIAHQAKEFGVSHIGLRNTGNYDTYVDVGRDALTYVVSAAPRDRLEPHLWHFPIVGAVPYKGFFSKKDALAEQQKLESRGLDTYVRGVAAFSLLGILRDPLYSTMLHGTPGDIANTVIHEMTHGTVFLSGNATFNEGFATYVGDEGSLEFLAERFGMNAPEYRQAVDEQQDSATFSAFIASAIADLRTFYSRTDLTAQQKIAGRQALFEEFKTRYRTLAFHRPGYGRFLDEPLNNAYFLLFDTYERDLGRFARARRHFGSLRAMVAFFRDTVARKPDPAAYFQDWENRLPPGR